MDGASTDGTPAIVERNATRIGFWVSEPDTGIYDAWNKALGHVTGDWICFLGADDRLHAPDVLERVAAALIADGGEHRVAFGDLDRYLLSGAVSERRYQPWAGGRRRRFRRGEMIPHPATFHHRSLFDDYGPFDARFAIAGDYEFLLRELLAHDPLHIPVVITDMGAGGVSERPAMRYVLTREVYRARYMHGIVKTPPWRSPQLYRASGGILGEAARHTADGPAPGSRDGGLTAARRYPSVSGASQPLSDAIRAASARFARPSSGSPRRGGCARPSDRPSAAAMSA